MVATENDEIDDSEILIRLIHHSFYGPNKILSCAAFRPNKNDIDGLSFYREYFTSAESLVLSRNKPGTDYLVCRLRAKDLRAIQEIRLTIIADPDSNPKNPRGHCIIPELRFETWSNNKALHNDVHSIFVRNAYESLSKVVLQTSLH